MWNWGQSFNVRDFLDSVCLKQAIARLSVDFAHAYNKYERSQQDSRIVFIIGVINDSCDSWATPKVPQAVSPFLYKLTTLILASFCLMHFTSNCC